MLLAGHSGGNVAKIYRGQNPNYISLVFLCASGIDFGSVPPACPSGDDTKFGHRSFMMFLTKGCVSCSETAREVICMISAVPCVHHKRYGRLRTALHARNRCENSLPSISPVSVYGCARVPPSSAGMSRRNRVRQYNTCSTRSRPTIVPRIPCCPSHPAAWLMPSDGPEGLGQMVKDLRDAVSEVRAAMTSHNDFFLN